MKKVLFLLFLFISLVRGSVDLNITLKDVNLSVNNITSIFAYTYDNYSIERLFIYDYYNRGGNNTIVNGEVNYNVPINYPNNKFSFEINITKDGVERDWFFDFNNSKLYPENNGSEIFKHEINTTDNNFTINLDSSNFVYYKFLGNLINNEKNVTDIILVNLGNFASFEQNLSPNSLSIDINFSELGSYKLKFVTDANKTWYYNFDTKKIESTYGGTTITLEESNLTAVFDVSKKQFDDYYIDLNMSLQNVNLSEHNVTSIVVRSVGDIYEYLYVYDYDTNLRTIINGENNYSVPIYHPDNNFSFEFYVLKNGYLTDWFYNFNDYKLYPDNNLSDEFKHEINISDSNFTINLNPENFDYYEFNGSLFENTKSIVTIKLNYFNSVIFENNVSDNSFDINFSEIGDYYLELITDDNNSWYYDFTTHNITSSPNGTHIYLGGNYTLDLNVSPVYFTDYIPIPFYQPIFINEVNTSAFCTVIFNETIDLIFAIYSESGTYKLKVFDTNLNLLSQVDINSCADKMIFSNDGTKLFLIGSDIQIIDISNPYTPVYLGSVSSGYTSSVFGADISDGDDVIYTSGSGGGFMAFDVSNPYVPTLIGSYDSAVGNVIFYGDKIYVSDETNGVLIFDEYNLSSKTAFLGDMYRVDAIAISNDGNYLFAMNYIDEFTPVNIKVIDVSDPNSPSIIETYNSVFGGVRKIATSKFQDILYIVSENDGYYSLEMVNFNNPSTLVNYYTMPIAEESEIFPDIVDSYIGLVGSNYSKIYQFMPYSNNNSFVSNPPVVNFGGRDLGTHTTQTITITNNSLIDGIVNLAGVTSPFSLSQNSCNLAINQSCTINVIYSPTSEGNHYNMVSLTGGNYIELMGYSYNPYYYYQPYYEPTSTPYYIEDTSFYNTPIYIEEPVMFEDVHYDFVPLDTPVFLTDEFGKAIDNPNFENIIMSELEDGGKLFEINYATSEDYKIYGAINFFEDKVTSTITIEYFGEKIETIIDIPSGFTTQIGKSGEIIQSFTDEDGFFTELITSAKGNVDLNLKTVNGKELEFKAPAGTKVEVKKDGTFTQGLDTKEVKTKIEGSKDGKSKVKLETTDNQKADFNLEIEANTEIRQDGSIVQKMENENSKTELEASKRADVKAVIENKNGTSIQLNPPKNAEVKVNSDNSISITNQFVTNEGSVKSQMKVNIDGSSDVEVDIGNERAIKKVTYSTRKDISKTKLEVLFDEVNSNLRDISESKLGRIKSTFSTRKEFSFKRDENLRAINENYNVVLTPEVSARFEENSYFNDNLNLKLSSGKANIKTIFSTRASFDNKNRVLQSSRREFSIKANKSLIQSNGKVSATLSEQGLETTLNANQQNGEVTANIFSFNQNSRSLKTTAKKLTYSVRKEFSDAKVEVIENSNARATKEKLKVTYSTRGSFSFKSSNLRVANEIIITPENEASKFQESINSSGERSIKLIEGNATIISEAKTSKMELNKVYDLAALELKSVELDLSTTQNAKVTLKKGWNLISAPIKENISDKFIFGNYDVVWNYKNQKWVKNPNVIYYGEGMWLKSNVSQDINFTGESYVPDLKHISQKWALVGSGKKIDDVNTLLRDEKIKEIYSYQDGNWSNSKTLKSINLGSGFWIEKVLADEILDIKKGWNLLSIPTSESISDMAILGNYEKILVYRNGEWLENPETISPNEGFWLNSNEELKLAFYGNQYSLKLEDLNSSGWSLVGGVIDENILNSIKTIWSFKNGEWKKIENEINFINSGDGFWIEK